MNVGDLVAVMNAAERSEVMTYPTSVTIRAHGPWWRYCDSFVRVREEDGRAWVLLTGGWVYVPNTDQSSWGGPVRLQPGDLVTGADAPEGAPSWLGVVKQIVISTYHHPYVETRAMGDVQEPGLFRYDNPTDLRPINDLEAVALAEALTRETWQQPDPDGEAGDWSLGPYPGVAFVAAGTWSLRDVDLHGSYGRVMDGKVAASRALLRWMCSP